MITRIRKRVEHRPTTPPILSSRSTLQTVSWSRNSSSLSCSAVALCFLLLVTSTSTCSSFGLMSLTTRTRTAAPSSVSKGLSSASTSCTRLDMVLSSRSYTVDSSTAASSSSSSSRQKKMMMTEGNNNNSEDQEMSLPQQQQRQQPMKQQQQQHQQQRRVRQKYKRKRGIPETERELRRRKKQWNDEYQKICQKSGPDKCPSIWSFESLFPKAEIDEDSVRKDLYGVRQQDEETTLRNSSGQNKKSKVMNQRKTSSTMMGSSSNNNQRAMSSSSSSRDGKTQMMGKMKSSFFGGPSMMRIWREPRRRSPYLPNAEKSDGSDMMDTPVVTAPTSNATTAWSGGQEQEYKAKTSVMANVLKRADAKNNTRIQQALQAEAAAQKEANKSGNKKKKKKTKGKVDRIMTRMVEDRMFGYRRTMVTGGSDGAGGERQEVYQYDTSLMGDGAIQFREGIRLGNPLRVNTDRLTYHARKELQHGRVEEAQELYEQAITIDPRDGRAYLGLAKCAERRRDFSLARDCLQAGITKSVSVGMDASQTPDRGANPYLLQALGCLEEKMGHLSSAESLYIAAVKSRPSHAAAWVALAGLRTKKLGQSAHAGRICYQTATRELERAGLKPSSHVCTAWAALEDKKAGNVRRARELFQKALKIDPKCSAALLQLGVMEAKCENWDEAQKCFDRVLQFDGRNSRVLQAYALMETKRPDGSSRKAIDLFERALKARPRDAGVLQAYGLYVAELGDVNAARELLRRGTKVNKRHAPVWQAWGVLETRHGSADEARSIFQQGIWACAQLTGSQSGGYHCARLWQAWGVLEAREGDHPAARRCFSRALDADNRNIPAITAWSQMEESLGNVMDARFIFERALKNFAPGSDDKNSLWRNFELMEQRLGNVTEAQKVYQRSMREAMTISEEVMVAEEGLELDAKNQKEKDKVQQEQLPALDTVLKKSTEVEVVRWNTGYDESRGSLGREVWLNDKAIEGKVPGFRQSNKKRNRK